MMSQSADATFAKWALVPLRVVVGITFLMHGYQKLFELGHAGTADILHWVGIPFASFFAVVLMIVEPLGALSILLGVFARWAGLVLAIEMTVAIFTARLKGGFFTPTGFEFELVLFGACLTIAALGSGPLSLDRLWAPAPVGSTTNV
jgi:putative oxidoreductase